MKSKKPFKPGKYYYIAVGRVSSRYPGYLWADTLRNYPESVSDAMRDWDDKADYRIQKVRIVEYKRRKR